MKLLSSGEFAQLARTTKRTILFYDEKGVLKPSKVSEAGYRFYHPNKIIDFQAISLLRQLGFSISEIKKYLKHKHSLKNIFLLKQKEIESEIKRLRYTLQKTKEFYKNLDKTGFLVKPFIKNMPSFSFYYLLKKGSYPKIKDYCFELKSCFKKIPKQAVFLTIFEEEGFHPKKCLMKIGVIAGSQLKLLKKKDSVVKMDLLPQYKALSYIHHGSGRFLSLLWESLSSYLNNHKYKQLKGMKCLEFYHQTSLNNVFNEDKHIFEIQIPIK